MNISLTEVTTDTDVIRAYLASTQAIERVRQRINAIRIDAIHRMHNFELPSIHNVYVGTTETTTTSKLRFGKRRQVTQTLPVFELQIAQSLIISPGNTGLSVSFKEIALLKQDKQPHYEVVDLKAMQAESPAEFAQLYELLKDICQHRHLMEFSYGW